MVDYSIDPRRNLALALQSQAISSEPVVHWSQAIARLGQALASKNMLQKSQEQENAANEALMQSGGDIKRLMGLLSSPSMKDNPYAKNLGSEIQQKSIMSKFLSGSNTVPASIQEYQYFKNLSPEEQQRMMALRRSPQILNLGGSQGVYNPLSGGLSQQFEVTPKPEQMPEFKQKQSEAIATGKNIASSIENLNDIQSKLPSLEKTVNRLGSLSNKATYTKVGQLINTGIKEIGANPTDGAVARTEYEAIVNNQILPLLRQTFGAQFTVQEGEELRKTLGDVNATPQQKQAVLKSFIEQKKNSIEDEIRKINIMSNQDYINIPQSAPTQDVIYNGNLTSQEQSKKRYIYDPSTGSFR